MEDERYATNWKWNSSFLKVFQRERREYIESIELSVDEGYLLFILEGYIKPQTNRVAKLCGNNFKNKELQEITNMGRDRVESSLSKLEENKFIKRVGNGKAREIYYNPYLVCTSNKIDTRTVNLFEDYIELKEGRV